MGNLINIILKLQIKITILFIQFWKPILSKTDDEYKEYLINLLEHGKTEKKS